MNGRLALDGCEGHGRADALQGCDSHCGPDLSGCQLIGSVEGRLKCAETSSFSIRGGGGANTDISSRSVSNK